MDDLSSARPDGSTPEMTFELTGSGVRAVGSPRASRFVVRAGSTARATHVRSFEKDVYFRLRERLKEEGRLGPGDAAEWLVFTEDVTFESPSAAASVTLGRVANGQTEWRSRDTGRALAEMLGSSAEAATSAPSTAFTWVPYFQALAVRLLNFEERQGELLGVLRGAGVQVNHDEGEELAAVDPFTFVSLICKHRDEKRLRTILARVGEALDLGAPVPADFTGLVWSNPMNAWFFAYRSSRQPGDIENLWRLARQTVSGTLEDATFRRALDTATVGLAKLTQGLFWLNPTAFLPLNSVNVPYLQRRGVTGAGSVTTLEEYEAVLIQARTLSGSYPQLSHEAWLETQQDKLVAQLDGGAFPFREFVQDVARYAEDVQRGNLVIDRKYAPLLLSLMNTADLTVLQPRQRPYTGSRAIRLKIGLGLGQTTLQSGDTSWYGRVYVFPEDGWDIVAYPAGLTSETGLPDGKGDEARTVLTNLAAKQAFVDVLMSAPQDLTIPATVLIAAEHGKMEPLPLRTERRADVERLIDTYIRGVGLSRRLMIHASLAPDELESDGFPERLEALLRFTDRVASACDALMRDGEALMLAAAREELVAERPTDEPALPNLPVGVPLNQILYGPPGTGKTYRVVDEALKILAPDFWAAHRDDRAALKATYDELTQAGRISFVTFHQSFGYEDFIEGIKPVMRGEQLRYELEDGVFLQAVRAAGGNLGGEPPARPAPLGDVRPDGRVWKLYMDGTSPVSRVRDLSVQRGEIRMGSWLGGALRLDGAAPVPNVTRPTDLTALPEDRLNAQQASFKDAMRAGDLVLLATGINRVGAVGVVTGEYRFDPHSDPVFAADYAHARRVRWLVQGAQLDAETLTGKAFNRTTLNVVQGVTSASVLAKLDLPTPDSARSTLRPHVLIIDEINRGNVAKIFGELITLLEGSKRDLQPEALAATLPLSKRTLRVPVSLYVIGTMNTADRSLSQLDAALRRRFQFRPVWPEPTALPVLSVDGATLDLRKFLYAVNLRVEALYDREHVIGHAYLMGLPSTLSGVAQALRERILPLLEEYFFEDWSKIRAVLADDFKPRELQFVHEDRAGDRARYTINDAAFLELEAFTRVYGGIEDRDFPFEA